MGRLLKYLLNNGELYIIRDEKIMTEVFENFGLRCSKQRLWQAMKSLQSMLERIDFQKDIFIRINSKGFSLRHIDRKSIFISD